MMIINHYTLFFKLENIKEIKIVSIPIQQEI